MKSTSDVISGLNKLIQGQVAQSGSEFVAAECREDSLIITANDGDGVRRQFSVAVTELNDAPPAAEETAGANEGAGECAGKPDEACGDASAEACDETAPTDASSDQAETPQSETTAETRDDPAAAPSAAG